MFLDVILEWADKPFAYGADCCQFAGKMVEAKTGRNPMDVFSYGDEAMANEIIESHGGLRAAVIHTLGDPVSPDLAEDGDVLLLNCDKGPVVGSAYLGRAVVRTERGGLTDWPLAWATDCWKV